MTSIGWKLRHLIRTNRRNAFAKAIALSAEKYLRVWHGDGFCDFDFDGERRVVEMFSQWAGSRPLTVWDVGAHEGEWAEDAHRHLATARIHSFEILKPTAERLTTKLGRESWSTIHNLGLSDRPGKIPVVWNGTHPMTSSVTPRLENRFFTGSTLKTFECDVTTADALVADGMPGPDLLKIDVEGHEAAVIRGAEQLLKGASAPALIQFEYGDTWLPASETLRAMHARLTEVGYRVGRVYPNYVAFDSYKSGDDNFRLGNFVAAKDTSLIALLAG